MSEMSDIVSEAGTKNPVYILLLPVCLYAPLFLGNRKPVGLDIWHRPLYRQGAAN